METNIRHLIDFEKVDTLLEGFCKSTGFVTAILDLEGNVLSKSGWRQICTEFHRVNPETSKKCTKSDTELANIVAQGKKYHFYKCLNGLIDVAVPIVINGEHIANLFSGQFFFEEPDISFFKKQAEKYGFDVKEYLDALSKVPIVSEEKVKTVMDFLLNMTQMISEITFQKIEQAELNKTIRESEEKQKSIFNNMTDVVWSISWPDLTHNFVSPSLEKLYGRSKQELLDNPNLFQDITHPDDKHLTEMAMKQLLEEGEAERECRIIRPDGSVVWVNDRSKMIYDENHQPIRVDGVTRNITERKQAEEEHLKFFTITEKALFGSFIADPDGNLVYVNDYFAQIHGYTVKELFGAKLDIFHNHSQMPLVRKTILDALERGNIEAVEIPHLHKNGHEFPMLMSLAIINGSLGKLKYIAATAFDLTEQKAIQQKLQNTVNNQNLMLDNDPTLIYFKDCNNNIIRVTESVAKATGLTREEIEGRPTKEIYPDMADQYWKDDLEVIKSGKPKQNIVESLTGVDGSSRWLMTTKVPVKNDSGEIVCICVFATDITGLKKAELELIAAKEKTEESEEKYRLLTEFAADVVWVLNLTTQKFTYISPSIFQLRGFTAEEAMNETLEETLTPESLTIVKDAITKNTKYFIEHPETNNYYINEIQQTCRNGQIIWVEVSTKFRFSPTGDIEVVGVSRNIDEKKRQKRLSAKTRKGFGLRLKQPTMLYGTGIL